MSRDPAAPAAWALVPVKDPARAKTRLAPVLSAGQREALQRAMLADVLAALGRARTLTGIAVIGPAGLADEIAGPGGVTMLAEEGAVDLNRSVAAGVGRLARAGAGIVAVVPADVPLVEAADIDLAVRRVAETGATVVVPDRHRQGTNALVFRAAAAPPFGFGPGSLHHHATRGSVILPLASLALDIDTPADLASLATDPRIPAATAAALKRFGAGGALQEMRP